MSDACERCLRRAWLLRELAGHLDPVRTEIAELLALDDEELIAAVGGRRRSELRHRLAVRDARPSRREARQMGIALICRCDPAYPDRLRDLAAPPAVLHVAGELEPFAAATTGCEPVAIVGARAASAYGQGVARSLSCSLAAAGVPVISGMAVGIDTAAHQGALAAEGLSVAVLPGPANQSYPRGSGSLHRRLVQAGAAVSELPPRLGVRSWMFLARNRIIAGLAAMTIVVEAGQRSAALLTARYAAELGRPVGAVPGRVTTAQAAGPNRLIKEGAHPVCGAQDVLDLLYEAGSRRAPTDARPKLTAELRELLEAIEAGHDTAAALSRRGILPEQGLAALASLELAGYLERGTGGRFTVVP